jgi:hypothetical protein
MVKFRIYVGFEVFTAVTMKNAVFWDVAPCRSCEMNRQFGGTYRLRLQGRKNPQQLLPTHAGSSIADFSTHIPEDGILPYLWLIFILHIFRIFYVLAEIPSDIL